MKKTIVLLSALCAAGLAATPAFSHGTCPLGFGDRTEHATPSAHQGFDAVKPITIKKLKETARDDDFVTLRGRFTKHVRSDKYQFTDEAGDTIVAELDDDKDWSHVRRDAPCEIWAKVDKDWNKIELDIKRVTPLR